MTDADYETLGVVITAAVRKAVTKATAPLESLIAELETKLSAVEARAMIPGPQGEKGLDGANGRDGLDGKDGADGRDGKDGAAGAQGEPGKDGAQGERGATGEKGLDGQPGRDGLPGVQGTAGRDGERGEKGLDGKDGRDGLDGTLEGVTVEQIDERSFAFKRADGAQLGIVSLPVPIDKGVYRDGDVYQKADGVTFGGSFFIAQRDTVAGEKPEDGSKAWRLAVKRGRDGREGKQGPQGERGFKGDRGDNGRNFS